MNDFAGFDFNSFIVLTHLDSVFLLIHESVHQSKLIRIKLLEQDQLERKDRVVGVRVDGRGFDSQNLFFLYLQRRWAKLITPLLEILSKSC